MSALYLPLLVNYYGNVVLNTIMLSCLVPQLYYTCPSCLSSSLPLHIHGFFFFKALPSVPLGVRCPLRTIALLATNALPLPIQAPDGLGARVCELKGSVRTCSHLILCILYMCKPLKETVIEDMEGFHNTFMELACASKTLKLCDHMVEHHMQFGWWLVRREELAPQMCNVDHKCLEPANLMLTHGLKACPERSFYFRSCTLT